MNRAAQERKAVQFRSLHNDGVLVLPNAWDVGSALLFQRAGAQAITTTNAGVSRGLGRRDGQRLARVEMIDLVAKITGEVDVPVSADITYGYGSEPHVVAETVHHLVNVGAVGIDLDDGRNIDRTLFSCDEQAARIMAARDAAARAGLAELVINARTDVFLLGVGAEAGRVEDVINRALAYAAASADTLFVPGLTDLETIRTIVERSPIPVNIMAGPGSPTIRQLADAGVRRVSVGDALARTAYTAVMHAVGELLTKGTYTSLHGVGRWAAIHEATGMTMTDSTRNLDDVVISHDEENRKYDACYRDDGIGVVVYERSAGQIIITHAAVQEAHRGYGVGGKLIRAALDHIQTLGPMIRVRCPVVREFIARNPRYAALTDQS
jgi:2-methylisocitrate lyase-like PEP mutase family enzyme